MRVAIAAGLVLALVIVPPARAASPDWQVAPLPVDADPSSEVRMLFDLGMDRFHAADYDQALIMWKRAFVPLPHDLGVQDLRATLVVDIVVAHGRAYQLGRNPEHLVEAMRVIGLREAEIDRYQDHDDARVAEMSNLDARRAELVRLHELALSQGEQPSKLADGMALVVEGPPPPTLTRKQLEADVAPPPPTPSGRELEATLATDEEFDRQFRRTKRMADGGFVVMIFGVAATPAYFLFTGWAFDPKDGFYEPISHLVPIAAFVGVTSIVGGTLFGVGKKRMKQIETKHEARRDRERRVVPMPISLRGGGGVGFAGRF